MALFLVYNLFFRYIIPVPIIEHFISGVKETGSYVGFCTMGLLCQSTENVQLREHFGMSAKMTGVFVSRINPLSAAHKVLKKDDIILAFDGVSIANDGTGRLIYKKDLRYFRFFPQFEITKMCFLLHLLAYCSSSSWQRENNI